MMTQIDFKPLSSSNFEDSPRSNTVLGTYTPNGPTCPLCGAWMRQRINKHGVFWRCTRHPDCRGVKVSASRLYIATSTRKRRHLKSKDQR